MDQSELNFTATLERHNLEIMPLSAETIQLNITRRCNQACLHCHVDASPGRTEVMSQPVIDQCMAVVAANTEIQTVDITGGAPELHPAFRQLVERAARLGRKVMVRHNLTVMLDRKLEDLPQFFARNGVEVIASLPYYQQFFTDRQRGDGVFEKSIAALRLLNAAGYGTDRSGLTLNLVYNPAGAFLPASQASLEDDFRRELQHKHGVMFDRLYALANMPVNRFRVQLERQGTYDDYMLKLQAAFNPAAALNMMCRSQMSVDWQGKVYDCDFNQMLGLQCATAAGDATVFNFDLLEFLKRRIAFGQHCFGCTAGAGSSCGGATT